LDALVVDHAHAISTERGGFPTEAFECLSRIEPGHYWFESRNRLIVWAIGRYCRGARTLLEVGCGTGFVLQGIDKTFPSLLLTASDAMPGGLAIAATRVPTAVLIQQDARALDAVERFDIVCAFDVLEHIVEDEDVLRRMFRATTPGGRILITVPQHPQLWSRTDTYARHLRRYRRHDLIARIRRAGFMPLRVTSFVSLLLPVLAVSRWADAVRPGWCSGREDSVPRLINTVLRAVLSIERQAIRCGVSWPAGGSLLAVARKPRP
jgi:SAM-dependent methyltransferase